VLLNVCSCCRRIEKCHPRLRSSGQRRLTSVSLMVVSCVWLKDVLVVAIWAIVASQPT
jgi:hypothetical protein